MNEAEKTTTSFFKSVGKWFYLFIAAAVLCVAATVVAIVLGVTSPEAPAPTPTPQEGMETGVYYYDAAGEAVLLSLNSGNKFTVAGQGLNKSGEYTVNGTTLTLDFAREEDGTATATVEGDSIVLNFNGAIMTFLKNVNYTVTFDSMGGTVLDEESVLNGKYATKPADPEKNGYAFIGWYADSALKTPYDFAASVIKADTTVYAGWVEKDFGRTEYTVDFDLGYEGADALADITTINGKLYGVKTPERLGYKFGGWFVSMYEDGNKLSYAYTEDTVFDANSTLYAVWYQDGAEKLAAPIVTVSDKAIKWGAISGVSSYRIKITDKDGNVLKTATTGATTFSEFDFTTKDAGDYVIEVIAEANNAENNSEACTRYYQNKALARVSTFRVINGLLVFEGVENAERYYVTVACGNASHKHTLVDNGSSTNYYFGSCTMQKGGIIFTVTAAANGYASSTSEPFAYDLTLMGVESIVYNKEQDAFVWSAVEDATGYSVTVVTADGTYTYTTAKNLFSAASYTGEITVKVTPVTDGYNSPDATEATATKTAPATPAGLTANGLVISWTATGADKYEIKIGSKTFTSTEMSFDLSTATGLELTDGQNYTIEVRAIKGDEASAFSAPFTIGYRSFVGNLSYENGIVYWTPALGCNAYEVRVNGEKAVAVTDATSAKVTLTKEGVNLIEVRCTDINSDWVAMQVTAYKVTLASRTLSGEFIKYLAIGDTLTLSTDLEREGYSFGGWFNVPDATGINGKEYTSGIFSIASDLTLYANWKANKYSIEYMVDDTVVTNIANGSLADVYFDNYFTLAIPTSKDDAAGIFMGWYTGPSGTGIQLTDSKGESLNPYSYTYQQPAYPFFDIDMDTLAYFLQSDGTYGVKAGPRINTVTQVRIPAIYKGVPVTRILDNGFKGSSRLKTIFIPDTITSIGVAAFENCNALEEYSVYVGRHDIIYEAVYSSANGALIYKDNASGRVYLEAFPRAKTGEFKTPEGVVDIRPFAFNNSNISKVIISKDIIYIAENAFYSCKKLTEIEYEYKRSETITVDANAFQSVSNVETLKLPALITPFSDIKCLDAFAALKNIEVEAGGSVYTAVDGFLCDANPMGVSIIYAPKSFKGKFEAPLGVSGIGDGLFQGSSVVTSVVIPSYVNRVGKNAFASTPVTSVTIEGERNQPLAIGDNAFKSCVSLNSVTVNGAQSKTNGAITFGTSVFEGCTALTKFTVGAGANVAKLGDNAFKNNLKLTTIDIADTAILAEIGKSAFYGCQKIEAFVIHATTATIGDSAFANCKYLVTLTFADSATPIAFGSSVFSGCERLKTIYLPASVTEFKDSVFESCSSLTEIIVDENSNTFESYNGSLYRKGLTEILFYPKNLDGDLTKLPWDNITKIGASVFKANNRIRNVVIGANVAEIGEGAFKDCTNLTSVSFNNKNKTALVIGDNAFSGCLQLSSATLPNTTTSIGAYAFQRTPITKFTIPAGITEIGAYSFAYTYLQSIIIPASVTNIGEGAFNNATRLSSVIFVGGTDTLTIGNASTAAGNGAFQKTALNTLILPKNVGDIGAYSFADITTLNSVTLPEGAKTNIIGDYAFYNTKLTSITLSEGLVEIGNSAFKDTNLMTVNIPASVKYIREYAFNTAPLSSVTFTNGSASEDELYIYNYAFASTSIATINLPAQLKSLGEHDEGYNYQTVDLVFNGNTTLHTITVDADNTVYTAFDGVLYLYGATEDDLILCHCPRAKTGTLNVPTNVVLVQATAFYGTHLTKIIFNDFAEDDEKYGKPILSIGSFIGQVNSNTDSKHAVFGNTETLTYIYLPSHTGWINSYAFVDFSYNANVKYELKFNTDAEGVEFKTRAIWMSDIDKATFPKITEIGGYSFYSMGPLSSVYFTPGSTYVEIPDCAFQSNRFTSFSVPATVTSIGKSAFYGCTDLASITFEGNKLVQIGDQAFQQTAFKSFTFPDSVTIVGKNIFQSCSSLETITINANITSIETMLSIHYHADNLKAFVVPSNHKTLKAVDGMLLSKDGTTLIACPASAGTVLTVPDGVRNISFGAFCWFKGEIVILPNTVETISNNAFEEARNLKLLVIPANVTSIGEKAFYNASALSTLAFAGGSKLTSIGKQAFCNAGITTLDIPDSVTSVGESAFSGCRSLTVAIMSAGIKSMPKSMFKNCTSLTSVLFQEGLTSIGDSAFEGCSSLSSIDVPDTVTSIALKAFKSCTSLSSVEFSLNSKLTSIGNELFSGCSNLTSVSFGDRLTSMSATDIFKGCNNLTSLRLPNALTSIPANFLAGCTKLESVNIPTGVRAIGNNAFQNCTGITEIVFESTITSIGSGAFSGCTELTSVTFRGGASLTTISGNAFANTTKLTSFEIPASVTSIGNGAFMNSAISEVKLTNRVTSIGSDAFSGCTNITSVSIPYSVSTIGARAFKDCTNLESIPLTAGINSIGDYAFENCAKITEIYLPATLNTLGNNPFAGCTGLASFTVDSENRNFSAQDGVLFDKGMLNLLIYPSSSTNEHFEMPDTVTGIAAGAFSGSQLKTIKLSENLTTLPSATFKNSALLESITIPHSITSIGANAFEGCSSLTAINIPSSVTSIGDSAFKDCAILSNVTFDDRLDAIAFGKGLFENCASITEVIIIPGMTAFKDNMFAGTGIVNAVIPNEIATLTASGVFEGCTALKSVTFPENAGNLGSNFFAGCTSLTTITLPTYVNLINNSTFADCTELTTVVFNGAVEKIGTSAFENCAKLTGVTFAGNPPTMIGVNEKAFKNCTSLTSVDFLEKANQINSEAFSGCTALTGEISISNKSCDIGDNIFAGTSPTKITITSMEANLTDYALNGLTADTTVYFASINSREGADRFANVISNTEATILFSDGAINPDEPDEPEVKLTDEEIKGIQNLPNEIRELADYLDVIQQAYLEYKKSGALDKVTSPEATQDEITNIEKLVASFEKIDSRLHSEIINLFTAKLNTLKKSLYVEEPDEPDVTPDEPEVKLTDEEIKGIQNLPNEIRELADYLDVIQQAYLEYKKSGALDKVTSPEATQDEITNIEKLVASFEKIDSRLHSEIINLFTTKLNTLKKSLYVEEPDEPEVTPDEPEVALTNEEIKGIEAILNVFPNITKLTDSEKFIASIKDAYLEYKKSGALDKIEKPEVTADEQKNIMNLVNELSVPDIADELSSYFMKELQALKEKLYSEQNA